MPRRLREHLPSQTYEAGRNTVEGMGYMADQANVLLFSHAVNCKEYGQVPAVLVAFDDGYRSITHDLSGDRSELWQYNNADVARTGRTAHRIPRTMNFYECGRQDETVLLGEEAVIERIVDLHERFGDEPDWDEAYDYVTSAMQAGLSALASKTVFPVLG